MSEPLYMVYAVWEYRRGRPDGVLRESTIALWFTDVEVATTNYRTMVLATNVKRATLWDKESNKLLKEYGRP